MREKILNMLEKNSRIDIKDMAGCGIDLITGDSVDFGGGLTIQGKTAMIIRTEEVSLP